MIDSNARTRRGSIVFEAFDGPRSPGLLDWLSKRRRFVEPASEIGIDEELLDRAFHHSSVVASWKFVASNGRDVATSSDLFTGIDEARLSAIETIVRVDELELLHTRGPLSSAPLGWLMRLDGAPRVIPVRWYSKQRLRLNSAASTIAGLRMVTVPTGPPSGDPAAELRRIGSNAARRPSPPLRSSNVDEEFDDGPIKTRGEPRPIRPIMRSWDQRPTRRTVRLGRREA